MIDWEKDKYLVPLLGVVVFVVGRRALIGGNSYFRGEFIVEHARQQHEAKRRQMGVTLRSDDLGRLRVQCRLQHEESLT